jgi:hypothetical protein
MNCRHVWDRVFLDEYLSHSWIESELKHHRANILWDRERSMMPATQDAVEFELGKRVALQSLKELKQIKNQLTCKLSIIRDEVWQRRIKAHDGADCPFHIINYKTIMPAKADRCGVCRLEIKNVERRVFREREKEISQQRDEISTRERELAFTAYGIYRGNRTVGLVPGERRKFIAACPDTECRGFLSTAYKCGVCAKHYCSACRELKEEKDDGIHTCDPGLVATINEIVKNSHPCPSCGTAISKIDGCDQMYCTGCFTAFSYITGKIVTGVIHNPHYYERMRKLHDGVVPPQQRGEMACNENGNPNIRWEQLPVNVRRNQTLMDAFRLIDHITYTVLNTYPTPAVLQDNVDIRVLYLLKEIDEKRIKQLIQQRDRVRQKKLEIRATIELCLLFMVDFFIDAPSIEKLPILRNKIREFVNAPLKKIGQRYKNIVPNIDIDEWKLCTVKWDGGYKKGTDDEKEEVEEEIFVSEFIEIV